MRASTCEAAFKPAPHTYRLPRSRLPPAAPSLSEAAGEVAGRSQCSRGSQLLAGSPQAPDPASPHSACKRITTKISSGYTCTQIPNS